jgi:hypothetical protein
MRRGLMAWDAEELPRAVLEARLARLRQQMREERFDAFVIYTNIARGAGACWLTGFTPYWNEGLLLVPADGVPLFATALSKRVAEWISSVMPLGDVITTPKPPALVAERLADAGARRVGVLELDDFPAGHAHTIVTAAPTVALFDGAAGFHRARGAPDACELLLIRRADALARQSLAASVGSAAVDPLALVARCEQDARLGGAEECFITLAPDLSRPGGFLRADRPHAFGATFALRVAVAYKGAWSRSVRSFAADAQMQQAFALADAALAAFSPASSSILKHECESIFAHVGTVRDWSAEQPRGSYALATVASADGCAEGFDPSAPFIINVDVEIVGARWRGARLVEPRA